MHEMALTEGILLVLKDQAKAQNYKRVKTVWLEIGELSHVDPDAIRFCFEAVTRDTIADGAVLEIDRLPGMAWCHHCTQAVNISKLADPCPICDGYQLQVTNGQDMRIRELEVD